MTELLTTLGLFLTAQVDPNQGTAQAARGAVERLTEPHIYDIISPVVAFLLVIVVPTGVAIWVIVKTLTDKATEDGDQAGSTDD